MRKASSHVCRDQHTEAPRPDARVALPICPCICTCIRRDDIQHPHPRVIQYAVTGEAGGTPSRAPGAHGADGLHDTARAVDMHAHPGGEHGYVNERPRARKTTICAATWSRRTRIMARAMITARRTGTFLPPMLAATLPPTDSDASRLRAMSTSTALNTIGNPEPEMPGRQQRPPRPTGPYIWLHPISTGINMLRHPVWTPAPALPYAPALVLASVLASVPVFVRMTVPSILVPTIPPADSTATRQRTTSTRAALSIPGTPEPETPGEQPDPARPSGTCRQLHRIPSGIRMLRRPCWMLAPPFPYALTYVPGHVRMTSSISLAAHVATLLPAESTATRHRAAGACRRWTPAPPLPYAHAYVPAYVRMTSSIDICRSCNTP